MNPTQIQCDLLVIGYGNTIRSDDGVGVRVAEAIEALGLPGVHTLALHQLSPEHAFPVSRAAAVVFVDACVDGSAEVQSRPLEPGPSSQILAHAADPGTLLALSRDVYGHVPKAWWLTIPIQSTDFGEELSPDVQHRRDEAVRMIRALV